MDLSGIRTKSGKTIADFHIPKNLLENDQELVDLIMKSESMNDDERQYWFNLTEVMNQEQIEKLRDILTRERKKLAEIDRKYGRIKEDPVKARKRAQELAQKRAAKQEEIKQKELASKNDNAEDILGELEHA